ncbi:Fic family protein [Microbacterium sp. CFH 90308]|uniref:Fic family protein n=1 Tax=Microbacterium salsuginis TaxID=2722803 RepID=A0ABX1KJA2_9MICO|nr:Fic family protein [Microbacterium sp. CFH 90308]NLP85446.1 Fic family protein [Microbacterium sp. CFH 90308]
MEDEASAGSLTRFLETTRGVLSYAEVADIVAEELLGLLDEVAEGDFSARALDADLLRSFHARILAGIIPEIAGAWRDVDVAVGRHLPPPWWQVPILVREFGENLLAQIEWCGSDLGRQIEVLAFAEGNILSIHPFVDFNGRATRAFLTEMIQRFDLPPVELSVARDTPRFDLYATALRAFDVGDPLPLREFWIDRFENW